jgi:hypothetical protein
MDHWTEWEAEPPFHVNDKSGNFNSAVAGSDCPFAKNSHGFIVTSSSQTSDAFTNVLTQISKLRVAK